MNSELNPAFKTWWDEHNQFSTDSDRLDHTVLVLSAPFQARRNAAEAAWTEAYQRGFRAAKEMAAQVLDNEIKQREHTDIDHMEPIDKLAEAIRSLEDNPA